MFLVTPCSCLRSIHWRQVLSWEWRCSWSSADRRCSNYIWVINNFIAYWGATYMRGFTVGVYRNQNVNLMSFATTYVGNFHFLESAFCIVASLKTHGHHMIITNDFLLSGRLIMNCSWFPEVPSAKAPATTRRPSDHQVSCNYSSMPWVSTIV